MTAPCIPRCRPFLYFGRFQVVYIVFLAALVLTLVSSSAHAQAPGTGTIRGRVQDAKTGSNLNNARVALDRTGQTVFTNEYGEYVLTDVPAGEAKVTAFFSGFEPKVTTVTVAAGQTVEQDLRFGTSGPDDTVVLDTLTIAGGRETNVAAIAVNEQRFAPNIKTVIETNAFGDIAEGNAGEFLKYLPGVTVDYVAADVRTVNVRGFGSAFTSVYVDGFRMASAASGSSIRSFEFEQVSINNAARIEVVKVPTADYPADALGGSVNMISKNAFEREGRAFNYSVYLNANSEDIIPWEKSPGPKNKDSYKVLPGFNFDYTLPISENLGFVITGLNSNQFNEQHRSQSTWNFAQAGATAANPYLQQYQVQDGPKNSFRDSFSFKADWKIAPGQSLWAMYQINYYQSFFGNRNLTFDVGTNATPLTAGDPGLTWTPDTVNGPTGRGTVRHGTSFRDKYGLANAGAVKYRFKNRDWEVDAGVGLSTSRSWYRDTDRGHFEEVRTTLQGLSRITYAGIQEPRPTTLTASAANGTSIDYLDLSNYRINTVRSRPLDAKDEFVSGHVNVKRNLDFLPFTSAVKFGADYRKQDRDIRRRDTSWNFVGADGLLNTADDNATPYLDTRYGPYPGWGFGHISWPDPYKLYEEFLAHPNFFQLSPAQALAAERFRLKNSQRLGETVVAPYALLDSHFLKNRLGIVAGVRYEHTKDTGNGVFSPTIGTSLADLQANWRERGNRASKSYDGFYPSVSATYNLTDDLLIRAAYARTLGRPDFGNILPLVRVNNTDTATDDGLGTLDPRTIVVTNPDLKPYQADNYDLSLEYYFHDGGVVSGGVFEKDIRDFFGTLSGPPTAQDLADLDLPAEYFNAGYTLRRTINVSGTSKITGFEFNYREPLSFIPGWGRYFTVFFNLTKLHLSGPNTADFSGFIKDSGNVGLSYDRFPLSVRLNLNYRGRQVNSLQTGAAYGFASSDSRVFREYYAPRFNLDANIEYKFSKNLGVFANVRNIFDQPQDLERYNPTSPDYSHLYRREKFGAQITMGVKGTF